MVCSIWSYQIPEPGDDKMEFQKLQAPSLKELFIRDIENRILSGELEIGAQLPTERELAERMGVSRAVVNGGISVLAGKGFLEIRPRVGIFVADYRSKGTMETLIAIMNYNGGMLRRSEVRSVLEFKLLMDTFCLRSLIPRVTDEDTDGLYARLERLRGCREPREAALAAFDYYHQLYLLSGNTFVPLIYYSFKPVIINLWQRYMRLYGVESIYRHSYGLFECIVNRDVDAAVARAEEYLGRAIQGDRQIYDD